MYFRRPSERNINLNKEKGNVVTFAQIRHAASLVAEGGMPDATYSEEECVVYEILKMFHDNPNRFKNRNR